MSGTAMDVMPDPLPLPPLPVLHGERVLLEVLAFNTRAIRCYLACDFRQEGVRRETELYPDGWKDLISMGLLRSEYKAH